MNQKIKNKIIAYLADNREQVAEAIIEEYPQPEHSWQEDVIEQDYHVIVSILDNLKDLVVKNETEND